MMPLSDSALTRLRSLPATPDFSTTRYKLREEIGRGGMGIVYRAFDETLARDVAIKILAPHLAGDDPTERLRQESRAIARLEHPGIVPVHDVGELPSGDVYCVMKLVRGERLDQRLRTATRGEALRWFVRICDAVAFAHSQGVVHRDLKPQNVMLGPFGEVLVLDWGVATVLAEPVAAAKTQAGTPGYMPPEQEQGQQVDARADIYALGKILRDICDATDREGGAPVRSIVQHATQPVPEDRYSSVALLSADVEAFLDNAPVRAHRESVIERIGRLASRHRFPLIIIVVYLLARLALLVVFRR